MVRTRDTGETVQEFARRFVDGAFDEMADLLTEDGRDAVVESFPTDFQQGPMDAEDAFEQYWWGLYGQYGPPVGVDELAVEGADATVDCSEATITLEFEEDTETAHLEVDNGGIAAFSFSPAYRTPGYVDENGFDERDVTVDAGDVELDGICTVPDGDGPFPAVVFVHGAGVHDPDGTVGASKLLRDVAWGLASEGIASLRYESRLAAHEVDDENHTLDTVVVDDAVASVETLAATERVDEDAVFVAGHSQGGMAAPRIADRHGGVAGVVSLDGSPESTLAPEHADIIRYEFERDGDLDEEQEAQLEEDRETLRRIRAGEFDDDETIMGRPGTWHRSLNEYDPKATASGLHVPLYVANTFLADEEAQPEVASFLRDRVEAWKTAGLPGGSSVKLYEGVDHFFQEGHAPKTPLSLYFGGTVTEDLVTDSAAWIHDVAML
ncbi:dienelactone hydrolase family protein [Haloarchaeobius sp. TZWWS8]|uniref:dienelactone hydrolase family protein n=1 Tax=Haloarchaeobius sp. TZWWS8 TaxID=3446121 RepID=UPI003EB9D122